MDAEAPVQDAGATSMSTVSKPLLTPQEYLAIEREAKHKSEYFGGEMFAMAGASSEHNLVAANIIASLVNQLRGRPCQTYTSDMRVLIRATGLFTYPDATVVCGPPQLFDNRRDVLLNPKVVVEVLSRSTESYDRGAKFDNYRRMESLQEYVLVAQNRAHVDVFSRQDDEQWRLTDATGLSASIELPSIGCTLALADVYDKLEFPPAGEQVLRPHYPAN
jgi:Uma2 family endonuclease